MPFCLLHVADVYIKTKNSLDKSGSNETMQNVLVSIVYLWWIFRKILGVKNFKNLNFCVFAPICVKFDMGDNIGQRKT